MADHTEERTRRGRMSVRGRQRNYINYTTLKNIFNAMEDVDKYGLKIGWEM